MTRHVALDRAIPTSTNRRGSGFALRPIRALTEKFVGPSGFLVAACAASLLTGCASPRDDGQGNDEAASGAAVDSAGTASALPDDTAPAPSASPEGSAEEELREAAHVLEAYYAAIDEGALERAYLLWADSGRASRQSFDGFSDGYSQTAEVALVTGEGTIEGAAGSRYAEIPVQIEALTRNGATQRFEGSYVLRRSVVDGATAEQRTWRIYSAEVREVR